MTPELLISFVSPCAAVLIVTLLLGVLAGWMLWPRGRRW